MKADDLFLMITLIGLLGMGLFVVIALVNSVKGYPAKEEWQRALFFFILAFVSFIFFGLTLT